MCLPLRPAGTIRVVGGSVRLLTAGEACGHHNCIELQEGRDLSVIDPELLDEVSNEKNYNTMASIYRICYLTNPFLLFILLFIGA
jgi:hypothetical protein